MTDEARLWLIRHAPVDGPRDIIHDPDAPADVRDTTAIARVRAQLPSSHTAFCSPARRTRETALALGLSPVLEPAFREQSFGEWTGRRHDDLRRELGPAYDAFWRAAASNRPPGGDSFVDQIARVTAGLQSLPAGDVVLVVHSGTIRAALAVALGITPENALRFVINPWSITRLDRLADAWRVVTVNGR